MSPEENVCSTPRSLTIYKRVNERERDVVGIAFPFTLVVDARAHRTADMMDGMLFWDLVQFPIVMLFHY